MNVHTILLYIIYVNPSTDTVIETINPIRYAVVGISLDEIVQTLVDHAEEKAQKEAPEGHKVQRGTIYCPHGPGRPKFKKFCADIKQQPLEDYAEDLDPDLTIQEALEVNPSCVTFLAKKLLAEDSGPDDDNYIVIKFARRYNKEAHVMMGELGFAPKLLGYCPLRDGESPYDNLVLLAMEYVEGGTLYEQYENRVLPTHVKRDVQEALQVLNGAGYIFADLRRPNLIVRESDGKVLLIDFDWVCRVDGGMRYPFHLSQDVKDRSGAKDNEVISLKHQEGMFEKL